MRISNELQSKMRFFLINLSCKHELNLKYHSPLKLNLDLCKLPRIMPTSQETRYTNRILFSPEKRKQITSITRTIRRCSRNPTKSTEMQKCVLTPCFYFLAFRQIVFAFCFGKFFHLRLTFNATKAANIFYSFIYASTHTDTDFDSEKRRNSFCFCFVPLL